MTMVPAEKKAKDLSSVNHTTKTIHRHRHHHHHHHYHQKLRKIKTSKNNKIKWQYRSEQ